MGTFLLTHSPERASHGDVSPDSPSPDFKKRVEKMDEDRITRARARMESARLSLEIRKATLSSTREQEEEDPEGERVSKKGLGIFIMIVGMVLGTIFLMTGSMIWCCILYGLGLGGLIMELMGKRSKEVQLQTQSVYEESVRVAQEFYDQCKAEYEALLSKEA